MSAEQTTPPTPDAGVNNIVRTLMKAKNGYVLEQGDALALHDEVTRLYKVASDLRVEVATLTAQLAAARADNDVLHHEVQMQLMELGMKAIGDHNRQFFRDDDDDARTGAR